MASEHEFDALIARSKEWSPSARETAAKLVQDLLEGKRRAWYCDRYDRTCDGEPHDRFPYPHARGDQWPPIGVDWFSWFLSGGRGSGKTRTGAEYTRRMTEHVSRMALVGPTGADVRDTMIEGESGLEFVCALAGYSITYEPTKRRVTFPNGCIATTFSSEKPARLRGPQHGFAWMDEPAHFENLEECWDNLLFGLRLGQRPHVVLTSTPLPNAWTRSIQEDEETVVVRVSTYANLKNLAPTYRKIVSRYEGTRTGRQELHGELLQDVIGALWSDAIIRHDTTIHPADLSRIVIGIDPAGTANKRSDLTGIVGVGSTGEYGYVLEDASGKYSPTGWANAALDMYARLRADAIVAEKNFGGDMVAEVIQRVAKERKMHVRVLVKTATRSKQVRAEPAVALYEQGKMFHVGDLAELELEQTTWVPSSGQPSPNRIDGLVWAMTDLFGLDTEITFAAPPTGRKIGRAPKGFGPRNPWRKPPRTGRGRAA